LLRTNKDNQGDKDNIPADCMQHLVIANATTIATSSNTSITTGTWGHIFETS